MIRDPDPSFQILEKRTPFAPVALLSAKILHFHFPIEACYAGYDDDNTGGGEEL